MSTTHQPPTFQFPRIPTTRNLSHLDTPDRPRLRHYRSQIDAPTLRYEPPLPKSQFSHHPTPTIPIHPPPFPSPIHHPIHTPNSYPFNYNREILSPFFTFSFPSQTLRYSNAIYSHSRTVNLKKSSATMRATPSLFYTQRSGADYLKVVRTSFTRLRNLTQILSIESV